MEGRLYFCHKNGQIYTRDELSESKRFIPPKCVGAVLRNFVAKFALKQLNYMNFPHNS